MPPVGEMPWKMPRVAPSLTRSLVRYEDDMPPDTTHMLAPSKAMPIAFSPTLKVPRSAPSLARSFVTLSAFVTQTLAPSKATPNVGDAKGKLPRSAPSLARSFVTPEPVASQILVPSQAPLRAPPAALDASGQCPVERRPIRAGLPTRNDFGIVEIDG
jgi:hypothetical protein